MVQPPHTNAPTQIIPDNILIIRNKQTPHAWSLLVLIGGMAIEGEIRPSTRRLLEGAYEVAVASEQAGETFEILSLTPKSKP